MEIREITEIREPGYDQAKAKSYVVKKRWQEDRVEAIKHRLGSATAALIRDSQSSVESLSLPCRNAAL